MRRMGTKQSSTNNHNCSPPTDTIPDWNHSMTTNTFTLTTRQPGGKKRKHEENKMTRIILIQEHGLNYLMILREPKLCGIAIICSYSKSMRKKKWMVLARKMSRRMY